MARAHGHDPLRLAEGIADLGLPWLQLRAKTLPAAEFLAQARRLQAVLEKYGGRTRLVINDRADIAALCPAGGLHVGQEDLPLAAARRLLPAPALLGLSTHRESQIRAALAEDAEISGEPLGASGTPRLHALAYLAFGPVYPTATKNNPDPVTGLEKLRRARALFSGTLVAIGGIRRENCAAAIQAGADFVAIISAWLAFADPLAEARHFLLALADSPAK